MDIEERVRQLEERLAQLEELVAPGPIDEALSVVRLGRFFAAKWQKERDVEGIKLLSGSNWGP